MKRPSKFPEIKLVSEETTTAEEAVILTTSHRDKTKIRTYEPNIDDLMIQPSGETVSLEKNWGKNDLPNPWPWKWMLALAAIGLLITGIFVYRPNDDQMPKINANIKALVIEQAEVLTTEDEARDTINRLELVGKQFFAATTSDDILPLVRDRKRVEPLILAHYAEQPLTASKVVNIPTLEPIPSRHGEEFWIGRFELIHGVSRYVIIEIDSSGEAKIDWESLVIHQPMKWDLFAKQRPKDQALNFRVYFSTSYAYPDPSFDPKTWRCLELSAANSESIVYGYIKDGTPLAGKILQLMSGDPKQHTAILRLNIPSSLQSERGVMIEELISPDWTHLTRSQP